MKNFGSVGWRRHKSELKRVCMLRFIVCTLHTGYYVYPLKDGKASVDETMKI